MPQITLELSNNVLENEFTDLLLSIHHILTKHLPTELRSCKSRVIRHQDYLIADGNANNAFVHLSINIMKGRTVELKNAVAAMLMETLQKTFASSFSQLDLQMTIAIADLPDVYSKLAHPV